MEERENLLDSLLTGVTEYAKTSFELIKLKAINQATQAVSSLAARFIALFIFSISLLMGSLGAAIWLGEILGKSWYGFLILAAFYGLIGVVTLLLRPLIKRLFGDHLIKKVLK